MSYVLKTFLTLGAWVGGVLIIILIIRAVCLHIQKRKEKKGDTFTPLSPTLQWMNTAGSILLALNGGNFRYMAGIFYPGWEHDEALTASIKKMLWEYWKIQGHESAMNQMTTLVHTGMRVWYDEEMTHLEALYSGYSEEELIEVAKQENSKATEDSFLPKMLMAYRRYGENAILGWDVGRAAYIIQCCYFVGYVSMEEVLEIGVEAGRKAQNYFNSWEEMMESYLLGGQYWKREDAKEPDSMTVKRWKIYEALWRGKKPYQKIPYITAAFDTPLSKEVITDKYGIMPTYQKFFQTKES